MIENHYRTSSYFSQGEMIEPHALWRQKCAPRLLFRQAAPIFLVINDALIKQFGQKTAINRSVAIIPTRSRKNGVLPSRVKVEKIEPVEETNELQTERALKQLVCTLIISFYAHSPGCPGEPGGPGIPGDPGRPSGPVDRVRVGEIVRHYV